MANQGEEFDLNLTRLLVVLIDEKSVSGAAHRLGVSQPTVSVGLRRLRELTGDPILARLGRGFVPTMHAVELAKLARPHLTALKETLSKRTPFDPRTSDRAFAIGMTDSCGYVFGAPLLKAVGQWAPHTRFRVVIAPMTDLMAMIGRDMISLAIGLASDKTIAAKQTILERPRWCCVFHKEYGALRSLEEYVSRVHLNITPGAQFAGMIDEALRALGLSRDVKYAVSSFAHAAAILESIPNLVLSAPDYVAAHLVAAHPRLALAPLPLDMPETPIAMYWPFSVDRDDAEKWLRGIVLEHIRASTAESQVVTVPSTGA